MKRVHSIISSLLLISSMIALAASEDSEGVILLHGLARSSRSMNKMSQHLQEAGFIVHNVSYPSRKADIETLSDSTLRKALANPELRTCSRIHFVTHSLGGILVRSYFSRHKEPRLGRVVMLGPPNQGSEVIDKIGDWWIVKAVNGPAGDELGTCDRSTPKTLGPAEFELGIIAGSRSINWINSLMIPGPDDGKVSVENTKVAGMTDHITLHATHTYLMKNKKAIKETLAFLKTGSFIKPRSQ